MVSNKRGYFCAMELENENLENSNYGEGRAVKWTALPSFIVGVTLPEGSRSLNHHDGSLPSCLSMTRLTKRDVQTHLFSIS